MNKIFKRFKPNSMSGINISKVRKQILSHILPRMFTVMVLFLFINLILYLLVYPFYHQFTFYGDEFIYKLANVLTHPAVILVYLFCGLAGIWIYYWMKVIGYLDEVIAATENIYTMDDRFIELSPQLADVAARMNQIKITVRSANQAAKDAEQRKNDLIVYLAHDLKTPLTSVIGYLTLLSDEKEISPALREKYLNISLEKAERLEELINDFFEITRFSLSHLTLDPYQINLTRMLEQTIYEFHPMFSEKGLTCRLNMAPDIQFCCDPDKLQRVFDNLLRNAVNYSFRDTEITIDVTLQDTQLHMSVTNHGHTIPAEKLSRIFEQFFRADASRGSKSGGAGLGLAIAREIIQLHHGTITAQSHDNLIIFHITLPTQLQ